MIIAEKQYTLLLSVYFFYGAMKTPDVRQRSLLNRLYFSPLRCVPGHRMFLLAGAALVLVALALRVTGARRGQWGEALAAAETWCTVAYTLLMLARYAVSYPGTNVIAHGNGHNRWTIHMGPAVSLLPWYYARQHSAFLRQDVYKVLHQIDRAGQAGSVRLESPLLADHVLRRLATAKLRSTFPHWTVHEDLRPAPLARLTAWQLTRLREALRRRKGARPFTPFHGGAPVGLILLTLPPQGSATLSAAPLKVG